MSALVIVVKQPFIQIGLQRVGAVIELLAECDLVELLRDSFMEAFADTVGLGIPAKEACWMSRGVRCS